MNIPKARKSFWTHPIELLGDVGHVQYRFGPFGDSVSFDARKVLDLVRLVIVLILTQDRCMVYAECTICLEVILDTPDRTPR